MRVGVLTSSRADYGIYLPLLRAIRSEPHLEAEIIAFGAHFSPAHGNSFEQILADGFELPHRLDTLVEGDRPLDIARAMAKTLTEFAGFWDRHRQRFRLVLAVGDRYEMFAAVSAAVPFNIAVAHLHGGERTRGSIDDQFRDAITRMSVCHFTSAEPYRDRVAAILGGRENIHVVGALSLDNLESMDLLDLEAFRKQYGIDLSRPTILLTYHPETIHPERSGDQARLIAGALDRLARYQIVITLPNLDTSGSDIRQVFQDFAAGRPDRVRIVENFGTRGYFSCMSNAALLMGNSSSGIIEAASLGKYVVNIGERQAGRLSGGNVLHVPLIEEAILGAVERIEASPPWSGGNPYWQGGAARRIIDSLIGFAHE